MVIKENIMLPIYCNVLFKKLNFANLLNSVFEKGVHGSNVAREKQQVPTTIRTK
jgi:hypothetical protein